MEEVIKKSEGKANAQKVSRVLLNARIAWCVFLFIVANPLIKSLLNPEFSLDGATSIDYVSHQPLLFFIMVFSLVMGFVTPSLVNKFRPKASQLTRLYVAFTLQSGFFLTVPIVGFIIALQEGRPALVFLFSTIGVFLFASNYPTKKRWALSNEDIDQAFVTEDDLVTQRKKSKIKTIIWSVVLVLVVLKVGYNFIQTQKSAKATAQQCRQDCFDLLTKGELQPGVSAEMCIEKSCK